jgi:hypothetical protein
MRKTRLDIGCALAALAVAAAATPAAAVTLLDYTGTFTGGHVFEIFGISIPGTYSISWTSPATFDSGSLSYGESHEIKAIQDDGTILDHSYGTVDIDPFVSLGGLHNFRAIYTLPPGVDKYYPPANGEPGVRYTETIHTVFFISGGVAETWNGTPYHLKVASAPEPAAWLLMIGGFFGAGSVLRRRRAGTELQSA